MARADLNSQWAAYRSYAGAREPWVTTIGDTSVSVSVSGTNVADLVEDPQIVEWVDLRGVAEFNALLRIRVQEYSGFITFGDPGIIIMSRMPDVSGDWATSNSGYAFQWRATKYGLSSDNVNDFFNGAVEDLATGTYYLVRYVVSNDTGSAATVQVRVWEEGTAEPGSWLVEQTFIGSEYIADVGRFGFSNGGNATASGAQSDATYSVELLAVSAFQDRVRSSVSEDAGSILDSTSLNAVDASFSEAFLLDRSLSSTATTAFVEALEPDVNAGVYYPIPRQGVEFLNDYSGETILSRMTRVYPPPIFTTVVDAGLTTFDIEDDTGTKVGDGATAQDVIDYVLTQWASTYDWFTFETVPDLRILSDGGYANAEAVPSEVIVFPQSGDDRLTMRQILDELLSPFPGTVVRATSSGSLSIVPSYGPDANATPVEVLTERDAYSITTGKPTPQGIFNACTVSSQPYVLTEDGGLLTQSAFQICHPSFPSGQLYNMTTDFSAYQDLSSDNPYPGGWRPSAWQPQSGRFPKTDADIKLTASGGTKQITMSYKDESGTTYASDPSEFTLKNIPTDGTTVEDAIVWTNGAAISPLNLQIAGRYDAASNTVQLWPAGFNRFFNFNGAHSFVLQLTDATDVWQKESYTVSATYNETTSSDDPIVATDGGNAVVDSVAAYGEREASIDISGYGITSADVLLKIAKGWVRRNIVPKLVRVIDQSVWRAFPVKFNHLGQTVQLPNGEVAVVVNRTYTDDFGVQYAEGTLTSTFKAEVVDRSGVGATDEAVQYLLLDNGEYLILDDSSLVPVGSVTDGTGSEPSGDYPVTALVYDGDVWVDPNAGGGGSGTAGSPYNNLADALSAVSDGERIIVRAGTLSVTSTLTSSTSFATGIEIFAYGSERPILDGSTLTSGNPVVSLSGTGVHFKGFEVIGGADKGVQVTAGTHTIEDLLVHGTYKEPVYVFSSSASNCLVQDVIAYEIGDPTVTGTNTADGMVATANSGTTTNGHKFVRCLVANAPDDAFDFFRGENCEAIDCVAIDAGYHHSAGDRSGDGNGFKLGGTEGGSNTATGCLSFGHKDTGFTWNLAASACTFTKNTSIGGITGFAASNGSTLTNNIANGASSATSFGSVTDSSNTWNFGITSPGFADAASDDYSLSATSPCIGVASDGGNLGASEAATELAFYWASRV